jgi:hypothetical protein
MALARTADGNQVKRPVGIFILGMHRSGTSVLTRILNLLGCSLPENLLGSNDSNPTGHWESARAIEINDGLLAAFGRRWDDVRSLPEDWMQRPEARLAKTQIHALLDREFSGKDLWLLKEPRLCRLAPLWLEVADEMGIDVRVVIPVRHPAEVDYSLARRDGLGVGRGQLLWCQHVLEAERCTRGRLRAFAAFDRLLSDWRSETDRIAAELEITWPRDAGKAARQINGFIKPRIRHMDANTENSILIGRAVPAVPISTFYRDLLAADTKHVWKVIEDFSEMLASVAPVFTPAIEDLSGALERGARQVASLGDTLARRESTQGVGENAELMGKLQQIDPLLVEMIQQIEAQRHELRQSVAAHSGETRAIRDKFEQISPLILEIIAQVEAQRREFGRHMQDSRAEHSQAQITQAEILAARAETLAAVRSELDLQRRLNAELTSDKQDLRIEASTRAQLQAQAAHAEILTAWTEMLAAVRSELDLQRRLNAELTVDKQDLRAEANAYARRADALAIELTKTSIALREYSTRTESLIDKLSALEAEIAAAEQARAASERALEAEIAAAEQARAASERALESMEQVSLSLRAEIDLLEESNRGLHHQTEMQARHIEALLDSTSWRLTAPIRGLRHIFSAKPARVEPVVHDQGRKGLIKSLYHALPISWPMRLQLKATAFRMTAPLIRNTGAYQRWLLTLPSVATLEPARDSAPAQARTPVAEGSLPATQIHYEYVPLAPDSVLLEELRAKLIAFYLPQFHPIPENDAWWGRGFTEWTNVSKALPQFAGHDQPRLPGELGFYDLRVPEVMRRQIELAQQYGVHGFCFHYYWFDGRRILERPLDQFLADTSLDFPFCLCWANENWTRRWDGRDQDVLLAQNHDKGSDLRFIADIAPLLRDPRYIRMDGRPLLIVYRPSQLPDCAATVARWREYCRDVGIGEILLVMVQFDAEDPRPFGFDAALEFPPHKLARDLPDINTTLPELNPTFRGYVIDYQSVVERAKNWPTPTFDLIRGVFPGWDNEARKPQEGYLFAHSSPERYRDWLEYAVEYSRQHPVAGEALVFVNAWNEWAEGAYLEPDRKHGYAYLQATRAALTQNRQACASPIRPGYIPTRIVVVSHDAHPHGAQYLSLHLCRELSRSLGCAVDAVLLGAGVLEDEFRKVATVHQLSNGAGTAAGRALAARLKASGAEFAIANTTVSGMFVSDLKQAGMRVVSLVHELPGVIESYGLREHTHCIARDADLVVFADAAIRDGFEQFAPLDPSRTLIRPQGLYKKNRFQSATSLLEARTLLRQKFGLDPEALIVLCVGYADLRKGADLFVSIGERLISQDKRVHMLWLGHPDLELEPALRAQVEASGLGGHFHFPGRDSDTDAYYAGSDLYALTSREDPFPSVVMEAFDVSLPVVGFAGAGGFESLLRRGGGRLVPAFDLDRFASECADLLGDRAARERLGAEGKALVEAEFSFPDYVRELLGRCGMHPPTVSVIVPNFNYARYLPQRLASIFGQSLPPYEVIVLDDASTDDSLAVLAELSTSMPFRLINNKENSGSVFRQWQRGVEAARGDFVWIAEADDLSEPEFLRCVISAFDRPDLAMSYCQSTQIDAQGQMLCPDYLDYVSDFGSDRWRSAFVTNLDEELRRGLAVKNTIPNVSAVVFRRDVLVSVLARHADEIASFRIAGDWMTYLQVLAHGGIAFQPQALNHHRRHASGITIGSENRPHLDEVQRVQHWVAERFGVDETTRGAAAAYIGFLHQYFGLEETPARA